jgi:2-polyprenyl-6-methoxyphenol hydroxylase-like FAD-dependent oxidoreductase
MSHFQIQTNVLIVGGGLAGASLAAVLASRGIDALLVDPRPRYPDDFRAEKLSPPQLASFDRLGLGPVVRRSATPIPFLTILRRGRVVAQRRNDEFGIDYAALVAAIRDLVPPQAQLTARVAALTTSTAGAQAELADGRQVSARLVVLATGLSQNLFAPLGITPCDVSRSHSLAIGFDLTAPSLGEACPSATIYGHGPHEGLGYLTLFPIGERVRANLFLYLAATDPWPRAFRAAPKASLDRLVPALTGCVPHYEVAGRPVIRPIHLQRSAEHVRAGVALIGDAFATTCPAAGGGVDKVLTDVECLSRLIPAWLSTPGMSADKIARYYADATKQACDRRASEAAFRARKMAIDTGLLWRARRQGVFAALRLKHRLADSFRAKGAEPDACGVGDLSPIG